MKCVKCGSELNPNSPFCGICGEVVVKEQPVVPAVPQEQPVIQEQPPPPPQKIFCGGCGKEVAPGTQICTHCGNLVTPITKKSPFARVGNIFSGLMKHWKILVAIVVVIALGVGGYFIYNGMKDGTKLSWDTKYGDFDTEYTVGGIVSLKVDAKEKDNTPIKNVTFTATGGEVTVAEDKVEWQLPAEAGVYTITAKIKSGKHITKDITVLENDFSIKLGGDMIDPGDQERPNPPSYPTPGTPSTEETTFTEAKDNIIVTATGTGDMWTTTIDINRNSTFSKTSGVLPNVYDVSTKGKLTKGTIQISFNLDELKAKNLEAKELALYSFNPDNKKLAMIDTAVDIQAQTLTAEVETFGKFIIADRTKVNVNSDVNLLFIIDDSVSMYSETQLEELGYKTIRGAEGNDIQFKRLELTKKVIDLLSPNYKVAIAQFALDFELEQKFTSDRKLAKQAVDRIANTLDRSNGTAIVKALTEGIKLFSKEDNALNFILLITDGKETVASIDQQKANIIKNANEKDIKICVIGLGDVDEKALREIAESTGCGFYYAKEASTLDEIYQMVGTSLNYDLVDTTGNGAIDSTIIADTGFVTTMDGFNFVNFPTAINPKGNSYGIHLFAQLHYMRELPHTLDAVDEWDMYFGGTTWYNMQAPSYNLRDTFFFNRGENANLYNFAFTTPIINTYMINPVDYRNKIEDGLFTIKKDYIDQLEKIAATIKESNYSGKNDAIKKFQYALLNTAAEEFKTNTEEEEYNFFQAITRLNALQINDERISFTSEPDKAYARLEKEIKKGVPVLVTINDSYAVNAIRILRDNKDSNKFKIEVYDSNYPGETRYINAERTKYNIKGLEEYTNEYQFTFHYDGKEVSLTLNIPNVR